MLIFSSLTSGRHPDHPQPAAQIPAAIRASSEEVNAQRLVLLPQAQQDSFRWDTTGLLFLFLLFLELRHSSRQKPIPLERLVKERESGKVWKVMSSEERAWGLWGHLKASIEQLIRFEQNIFLSNLNPSHIFKAELWQPGSHAVIFAGGCKDLSYL